MAQFLIGDVAGEAVQGFAVLNDYDIELGPTAGICRLTVKAGGDINWGPGLAAQDVTLGRSAAGRLFVAGQLGASGFRVAEGSNARMGVVTLVAGSATVSTNKVTANSRIFLTHQNVAGTPGAVFVSARIAGASFTISGVATDTSDVAWLIVEPD